MTRWFQVLFAVVSCVGLSVPIARAEDKPVVPLKVQVVIARYQGEKKISSLPYTMVVNANLNKTSLRFDSQIPVVTGAYPPSSEKNPPAPLQSYQYRSVGTNIDCSARSAEDGRFQLDITVNDSSILPADRQIQTVSGPGIPSFTGFSSVNSILLRDGQTMEFTTATDKATGEVTKVSVTLNVLK